MANAGVNTSLPDYTQGVNTDDNQFFITTGSPNQVLGYGYTIFGQMLAGQDVIAKMTQVPLVDGSGPGLDQTQPANPLVMTSLSFSTGNPSGVAIIDTSQARPGDTATFQVTATDAHGSVSQDFTVTASPYTGEFAAARRPCHRLQAVRQRGHGDRGRGRLDSHHRDGPERLSRYHRHAVLQSHIFLHRGRAAEPRQADSDKLVNHHPDRRLHLYARSGLLRPGFVPVHDHGGRADAVSRQQPEHRRPVFRTRRAHDQQPGDRDDHGHAHADTDHADAHRPHPHRRRPHPRPRRPHPHPRRSRRPRRPYRLRS